ncbi:RNA polymerase II elongation factor ELL2-like protein [Leptotrombidium deliense]|uniref:RNA polymerase II elongation factor ELL2-like protein n=1 Tax=Leptotrombidium deliense TaxID=299467 RepID=A0A443SPW4_9ACAR|nr:RNA polymerase II elongation factor ELL2-like protein [Leptotrombidium deliense]
MESLGSMQYKMQIHASEDSYQKTKARMAVAEQESKKNCTKVIKDSGPNVGRKVKVKKVFSHHQPGLSHHSHNAKPNSPPTLKLNGVCVSNKPNLANKASPVSNQANSDIVRRPLKDRMIHLLALRPYKKPELMIRLNKDGLKERDKKGMSAFLNQIATLKDNVYHLARHAWHEVQIDEWPFYTVEERELIRRKNPLLNVQTQHSSALNTLSPLSSDCSSLQDSPSPPNLMNLNVNSPSSHSAHSTKRAIESASSNLKRQRIAHLNPPPQPYSRTKSPNANLQTSGYSDVLNGWANKPKSPENSKNGASTKNTVIGNHWNYSNGTSDLRPESQLSSIKSNNYLSPDSNGIVQQSQSANQSITTHLTNGFSNNAISNASKKVAKNGHVYRNGSNAANVPQNSVNANAYTNESTCSTPNSSPDSGTGSNDGSLSTTSSRSLSSTNGETPDFILKYVEITSDAQRAKYKSDFNYEYGEYRALHRQLEVVAKRFAELESELKSTPEGSDEWNVSVSTVFEYVIENSSQRIMDQIIKEYEETKRDAKYVEARRKVAYLHEKLSHIKKLVNNYDKQFPENVKRAARSKKSKRLTS